MTCDHGIALANKQTGEERCAECGEVVAAGDGTNDPAYVWLEASCGHELRWPASEVAPAHCECSQHGYVALWAQRNHPSPDGLPPMPAALTSPEART